jgi:N-acetylglucosaminyl-diphospho-decaprenol L-rhamnosyltransferase
MDLSIIIVNYNVKYFLEHCLLSVIKACTAVDAEIIVVDNNSTDGSEEYLSSKFPAVNFIWSKENPGFGKANNRALAQAKGDYILFLNPDTIVPEDCFTKCISFFKVNADCGALGVRMIDGSGNFLPESKRSLPTPLSGFYKMIGLANLFPQSKAFASYYDGHLAEKENNKTEVLAGAFMMLSKKAVEITKGFDEDFFMYGEDIDLSYRIIKAGLSNYHLGKVPIIHFKGESTQKQSANYARHFYGAMKLFVDKHYKDSGFKRAAMNAAISSGKLAANIRQRFSSGKTNHTNLNIGKIISTGSKVQIEFAQSLLHSEIESIGPEKIKEASSIKADTILLCEGELSNKEIIDFIQQHPNEYQYLFYESGAMSIIGSNNKNTNGFAAA